MKCVKCGRIIDDDSMFCEYCGEPMQIIEEEPRSQYRREFDSYSKCPFCGAVLGSFKAYCDFCGHELRKEKADMVIGRLSNALAEVDVQKQQHESSYVNIFMRSVYGKNVDTFDDVERKVNIISNFAIPTDRENLLEFMIMAYSNIKVEAYNTQQKPMDDSIMRLNQAWLSKM